jgi:uncharacterized protein YgbK (DUF1537 family)
VGNVRRSGLPQVERGGAISPLPIPTTAGLVEQIHVVFFPDQIVGSEFNFYGPRMASLAHYFAVKADGVCPPVKFEPLLRQNVTQQLDRLQDVRLLQLKIRSSYAAVVSQADQDLGSAFEAAARAGDADELEIILRPRAYSRGQLSQRVLDTMRRLLQRPDLREEASRFIVKGMDSVTGRVELVDFLGDQLISRKQIILQDRRTRALDQESAYSAIQAAYDELRDQLVTAASVDL